MTGAGEWQRGGVPGRTRGVNPGLLVDPAALQALRGDLQPLELRVGLCSARRFAGQALWGIGEQRGEMAGSSPRPAGGR